GAAPGGGEQARREGQGRGGAEAGRAFLRRGRQVRRLPVQRGRRRVGRAAVGALRRVLDLGGDLLVRGQRRGRAVPGAAVGVGGGVGERPVDRDAARGDGAVVGGRPDQRVPESDAAPGEVSPS